MSIQSLIYDDEHHIHRLQGFYIGGIYYNIRLTEAPGNGTVYINLKLSQNVTDLIKKFVWVYSSGRDPKLDYYTELVRYTAKRKSKPMAPDYRVPVQVAGAAFPVRTLPYLCDGVTLHIANKITPVFSEPSINYIESYLGASTWSECVSRHTSSGDKYFDFAIGLLDDSNFSEYKSILLRYHLQHHKYAHNGIDNIDTLVGMFGNDDYYTLQTIHSLCHIYDGLYMFEADTTDAYEYLDMLVSYEKLLVDPRETYCLERALNECAADFLQCDATGKILLPYTIKAEALGDKKRQYDENKDMLLKSFHQQIDGGADPVHCGTTNKLPNT